jgi:hypothetical protein
MKYKNESEVIGKKWGLLTALKFVGYKETGKNKKRKALFLFECECGKKCKKVLNSVKSGNTKTCGNSIHRRKKTFIEDLTGKEFGRLTVKSFNGLVTKKYSGINRTKEKWNCECVCGKKVCRTRNTLISNNTLSCGCLLNERRGKNPPRLPKGVAAFNSYFKSYIDRSRKKGVQFLLSEDDFKKLVYSECFYCGVPPERPYPKTKKTNGKIFVNGVDRINSSLGYTISNCCSCCEICNKAKRDLTKEDFEEWINRLVKHQKK